MHTLQTETLKRYRKMFKNEPLRVTSQKTGLQLTRVFRIFNGYEMKLSEYLSFQRVIATNRDPNSTSESCPHTIDFQYLTKNFFKLDEKTVNYIRRKVEFTLELKKLSQASIMSCPEVMQ